MRRGSQLVQLFVRERKYRKSYRAFAGGNTSDATGCRDRSLAPWLLACGGLGTRSTYERLAHAGYKTQRVEGRQLHKSLNYFWVLLVLTYVIFFLRQSLFSSSFLLPECISMENQPHYISILGGSHSLIIYLRGEPQPDYLS